MRVHKCLCVDRSVCLPTHCILYESKLYFLTSENFKIKCCYSPWKFSHLFLFSHFWLTHIITVFLLGNHFRNSNLKKRFLTMKSTSAVKVPKHENAWAFDLRQIQSWVFVLHSYKEKKAKQNYVLHLFKCICIWR